MTNSMLMTMADVCAFLSTSKSTLRRMRREGIFPEGEVLFGRKLYWLREVVEAFAAKKFRTEQTAT